MPYRIVWILIAGLLLSPLLGAQEIILDYPSGRFQEDQPPAFFRWSLYGEAKTLTIKIYRLNSDGTLEPTRSLISRFDFLSEVQSMPWPLEPLGRGEYVWSIEGYDDQSPQPRFRRELGFVVEPLTYLDLTTSRFGLQVGFSRGTYLSKETNYAVDFQTTPTVYGVLYRRGTRNRILDLSAAMTDFTVRGSVKQSVDGFASYSYRISAPNVSRTDFFAGFSLRSLSFPRVHSSDGVNLTTLNVTQLSPGILLSGQKRFDHKITMYSQFFFDLPVFATRKSASSANELGIGATGGLLFGQFWPLSFGGQLQYRLDQSTTFDDSNRIHVRMEELSLLLNTTYAL